MRSDWISGGDKDDSLTCFFIFLIWLDDNYFCKKPACKRKGGFDAAPGAPFVSFKIAFLFCENALKVIYYLL